MLQTVAQEKILLIYEIEDNMETTSMCVYMSWETRPYGTEGRKWLTYVDKRGRERDNEGE
jgi:hypothetical protein